MNQFTNDKVQNAINREIENNKNLYETSTNVGPIQLIHWTDDSAPNVDYKSILEHHCGSLNYVIITKQKENGDWCHLCYCKNHCNRMGFFLPFVISQISPEFIMPFGKYKDQKLKDIPRDYLCWISENLENKKFGNKIKKYLSELSSET